MSEKYSEEEIKQMSREITNAIWLILYLICLAVAVVNTLTGDYERASVFWGATIFFKLTL